MEHFGKEFAGTILGGNALQPTTTAKTIRVREGKRLTTDGPFAETKEQLGGYYLVEARCRGSDRYRRENPVGASWID